MSTRSKLLSSALAFSLSSAALPALADVPVVKTDHAEVDVGGMTQVYGMGQHLTDGFKDDNRVYLYMKEARLRLNGQYDGYAVHVELGLGPEDVVAAPSPGIALGLLDFNVDIPLKFLPSAYVKVGQMKVPYGRERLTYSGYSTFVDRSVEDVGFRVGRDVGAALVLQPRPFTLIAGVFTGGGRDVPPRQIPEKIGVPMLVLRAGVGDTGEDAFALHAHDARQDKARGAFFVNALYTRDSLIGHSTVLNVKLADKSLLLDGNWNPAIGKFPFDPGQFWQVGADAAFSAPLGDGYCASGQAEVNYAGYSNQSGAFNLAGGQAQASLSKGAFLVALRYAVLFPDEYFQNGLFITGSAPIQEITPALTWALRGDNLKLVADLPILVGAPIATEANVGSYVLTELPQETSVLAKGGAVSRQNVIEARLMLQAMF